MGLFGKKKAEEIKKPACACNGGCPTQEVTEAEIKACSCGCGKLTVKVLGAGCASCHQQYVNVQEAVKNMALDAEVEYVTDLAKVMEYGVMSVPAIVVNDKVVSMGKVLKPADVQSLLQKLGF